MVKKRDGDLTLEPIRRCISSFLDVHRTFHLKKRGSMDSPDCDTNTPCASAIAHVLSSLPNEQTRIRAESIWTEFISRFDPQSAQGRQDLVDNALELYLATSDATIRSLAEERLKHLLPAIPNRRYFFRIATSPRSSVEFAAVACGTYIDLSHQTAENLETLLHITRFPKDLRERIAKRLISCPDISLRALEHVGEHFIEVLRKAGLEGRLLCMRKNYACLGEALEQITELQRPKPASA